MYCLWIRCISGVLILVIALIQLRRCIQLFDSLWSFCVARPTPSAYMIQMWSTLLEFFFSCLMLYLLYFNCVLQLGLSDLNLVYACSRDKTLMIDVQAREITERDLQAGMKLAHAEVLFYLHILALL